MSGMFELNLPENLDSLEKSVEYIVPLVQQWSEDLWEENFYVNKRWKEIRDTDTYHEVVLHMFMSDGVYMVVIDGDISKGGWRYLKETNTFIVDYGGKSSLFDLVFLNNDFFIIKKHGDQSRKGRQKYYVYGNEKSTGRLTWNAAMEKLFSLYRDSSQFSKSLYIVIGAIVFIIFLLFNFR